MTGNLNMGSYKVISTYVPLSGSDLVNKTYVDALVSSSSGISQSNADLRYL